MDLNLPLHPLAVHFPVVLSVIIALLVAYITFVRAERQRSHWAALVVFSGAFLITSLLAVVFGDIDEDIVESFVSESSLESHEEWGEKVLWLASVLLGLSLLVWQFKESKALMYLTASAALISLGFAMWGTQGLNWLKIKTRKRTMKTIKKGLLIFLVLSSTLSWAQEENKELDLSITDLGFTQEATMPSLELQRTLDEREYYLRQHQIWGLVAAGAMGAALLSGGEGDLPPEHPFVAGLAVAAYGAAAYTAWKAPELPGASVKGGSAWHRRLAWVHAPGMILTPILGYMAAKKLDNGEKLDGIEKYHKDIAGVTAVALALSVFTVTFEF